MTTEAVRRLLALYGSEVRGLAMKARELVREVIPDAVEEVDTTAKVIGYSYIPGTYKGLIVAIAPQRAYVNLMFSKGVELMGLDSAALLAGTGKLARHIRLASPDRLDEPQVRELIRAAATLTPR